MPRDIPEMKFTCLQVGDLAYQLALNTQALFPDDATLQQFNPNGGGGPGVRGIMKVQQYDQNNNLIMNFQTWVFLQLSGGLKGGPKTMTKAEFMGTMLYSANNTGAA